jgi:flagellar hook-associated protein 1 FlgK
MDDYSIALSGLDAVKKALDVIGNNIANAATNGYHRQRIDLAPAYTSQVGPVLVGGGVDVQGVTRIIDTLLEKEILRQNATLGQVSQELTTLQMIEDAFGELASGSSLSATIDDFFNALQDLSAHPSEIIWQTQAVTAGETLAAQFRTLGEFFVRLETQIRLEAENTIGTINTLTSQIARLNDSIERLEVTSTQAGNLRDQRDQLIAELSELVAVETQSREYGVVDVTIAGLPAVVGATGYELQVALTEDNKLGICIADAHNYDTNVYGGRLGGLLTLGNELLAQIHTDLDALALAIVQQINQYHVQGVGSAGSFTELTGWPMPSEDLADFDPPITDGKIYIRVTNTGTGEITRHEIDIDASTDSLTGIAADISAITGLSASVASSSLHIQAETGYKFDFSPAVLSEPTATNLTGTSPPTISVSGIYTGAENQTFQFRVIGTGSVGNGALELEVKNGAGEVVTTLNVGAGYAAGDKLSIGSGIALSLSTGDLNDADSFEVDAFANTDTSGLLAAAGINTFFSGNSAATMRVCSDIVSSPARLATALTAELTDNTNAVRLAELRDRAVSSLDSMTPGEFYRCLVTDIAQQLSVKGLRQDNIEVVLQNLGRRQTEISGVNINDEAAQLLIFEQMFQALAKYMNTIQSSLQAVMDII